MAAPATPTARPPNRGRNPDRVFVKTRFTNKLGAAKAHIRYIAFRSREVPENEKGIFDREQDHAQVDKFIKRLDDKLTRHPEVPKLHKLVLSFSDEQWRNCGYTSWKPIAREVMEAFEKRTGKQVEWVGAEHMAKGHPHCHIAMKATYRDKDGKEHRLRLTKDDVKVFKEEMRRIYERDRHLSRPLQQAVKKEAWQLQAPQIAKATKTILDRIAAAARQQQHQQEMERHLLAEQETRRLQQIERQRERERGR
jgi:hypothetical protein